MTSPSRKSTSHCSVASKEPLHVSLESVELLSTVFFVLTPRSRESCAEEGVNPEVDFAAKTVKEFDLLSLGNKEVAAMRLEHYNNRRLQLLELVRGRRHRKLGSPQLVNSSTPLQCHTATASDEQSETKRSTSPSDFKLPKVALSPEGVQLKSDQTMIVSANKMERSKSVAAANERRDQQQGKQAETIRLQIEQQEQGRLQKRIRKEAQQKAHDSEIRKRDHELYILSVEKERAQRFHDEAAQKVKEEQLQAMTIREDMRLALFAERRIEIDLAAFERKQCLLQRQQSILLQCQGSQEERRVLMEQKMDDAESKRKRQEEHQRVVLEAKSLEARHREGEYRRKREAADFDHKRRITILQQRAKDNNDRIELIEEGKRHARVLKQVDDVKKAQERRDARGFLQREAKTHANEIEKRFEEQEIKQLNIFVEQRQENIIRKAKKDLAAEDRLEDVARHHRVLDHLRGLAAEKMEHKLLRVKIAHDDVRECDEKRKQAQRESLVNRQAKNSSRPQYWTPGPNAYSTIEAEEYLRGRGTEVKFATAGREKLRPSQVPGPGHYNVRAPWRKIGPKMPPQYMSPGRSGSLSRGLVHSSPKPLSALSFREEPPLDFQDEDYIE